MVAELRLLFLGSRVRLVCLLLATLVWSLVCPVGRLAWPRRGVCLRVFVALGVATVVSASRCGRPGAGRDLRQLGGIPSGASCLGKRCLGNKIVRVRARLIRSCFCHLIIACVEIRRDVACFRAHRSLCVRTQECMCAVMGTREASAVFLTLAFFART